MAVVKNTEVVEVDGVTYTVTELGALDKMRCFAGLSKESSPVEQAEAVCKALAKSVYVGDALAFEDMEAAGSVSMETFNSLSEAFTRVNEGPKT